MSETTKRAQSSSGASGADPLLEKDAEPAASGGRRGEEQGGRTWSGEGEASGDGCAR